MNCFTDADKRLKLVIRARNGCKDWGCLIKLYYTGRVGEILTSSRKLCQILGSYALLINLCSLIILDKMCDTLESPVSLVHNYLEHHVSGSDIFICRCTSDAEK